MSLLSAYTVLLFINLHATASSETIMCDGNNQICKSDTINCTDHETCQITCTVASDCIGITIYCPQKEDCIVQCHLTKGDNGCQISSIMATDSLSLKIENQDVDRGFQGTSIYCPFDGNCTISGSGNSAYQYMQIYAIFGFVFNTVSVLCTGVECNNEITMNCGNNYISSCITDPSTGNSCKNISSTCDTIFKAITHIWHDDYDIHPSPGWIITDYNNNLINSIFTGTLDIYHGPYYGNNNTQDIDVFTLTQYFYCFTASDVYVHYIYGVLCQSATSWSHLYLNDQLLADVNANVSKGKPLADNALNSEWHGSCNDVWQKTASNGSLGVVRPDKFFKVEIQVALQSNKEASVITDFQIICEPTAKPTYASQTYQTKSVDDGVGLMIMELFIIFGVICWGTICVTPFISRLLNGNVVLAPDSPEFETKHEATVETDIERKKPTYVAADRSVTTSLIMNDIASASKKLLDHK